MEEKLKHMYYNEKMSFRDIASVFGVGLTSISRWMNKCGIESRTISESMLVDSSKPSKKELEEMYYNEKMTQKEIAELYNVSQTAVSKWLISYDIKSRTNSESKLGIIKKINPLRLSKKGLEDMYISKKMSTYEIADKIGVVQSTILLWFKIYGIESRTISESVSGENHHNWHGGISGRGYCYKFDDRFKEAVRKRDGYTCQLCGFEQNNEKLSIHHIHYDKPNCWPDVITLCRSCNAIVNFDRDFWEKYFDDQLGQKELLNWRLSQET